MSSNPRESFGFFGSRSVPKNIRESFGFFGTLREPDDIINREVLKAAVMRRITCPYSGAILDVRSAVYFHVETSGGASGGECVTGTQWDSMAAALVAACERQNVTLEVIDGRTLS